MSDEKFFQGLVLPHVHKLKAYTSARSEFLGEADLLDANEYPFGHEGDELELHRYPEPQPSALRARLASLYRVDEAQLLLCRGADEAIDLLVMATAHPGDCIGINSSPTYGMYQVSAESHGTHLIDVPMRQGAEDFTYDIDAIIEKWPNTGGKLAFLCTPNNPTGGVTGLGEIARLCEALRKEDAPGLVVVDEAYIEFSDSDSATTLLEAHPNLVVLRTLSKAWGLAGARLGVGIANPHLIGLLRKIQAPLPHFTAIGGSRVRSPRR